MVPGLRPPQLSVLKSSEHGREQVALTGFRLVKSPSLRNLGGERVMSIEPRWGMGSLLSDQEGRERILPTELRLGVGSVHRNQEVGPLVRTRAWTKEAAGSRHRIWGASGSTPQKTGREGRSHFCHTTQASARTLAQSWQLPLRSTRLRQVFSPFATHIMQQSKT